MNQLTTPAIILSRINYGEADRILTLLTPEYGKLSLIAKGVRRVKSKLAGGIELFSVSDIGFIRGRAGATGLGTLVSSQLVTYYSHIVSDVERTMLGYDLIKQLNKVSEDEPEAAYFELLEQAFAALDNFTVDGRLIRIWFLMQLLRIGGHTPNLVSDTAGERLAATSRYSFDYDDMTFVPRPDAAYSSDQIKFLRLGLAGTRPDVLQKVEGLSGLLDQTGPLIQTVASSQLNL